jgi:hypothetical protein
MLTNGLATQADLDALDKQVRGGCGSTLGGPDGSGAREKGGLLLLPWPSCPLCCCPGQAVRPSAAARAQVFTTLPAPLAAPAQLPAHPPTPAFLPPPPAAAGDGCGGGLRAVR